MGGEADVQTATVKKQSSMMSPEAQARAELFSQVTPFILSHDCCVQSSAIIYSHMQSIGSGRGLRHRG